MKSESNIRPNMIEIENIQNDRCDIVIVANIEEVIEEENTKYIFDIYRMNICYHENIKSEIENSYEKYLGIAKNNEYKILAAEVRKKRDELLKETDKEMCLDRLKLTIPKEITTINLLAGVKEFFEGLSQISNSNISKYRQELRDIPQQEGFPYNIIWPSKKDL